MGNCGPSSYHGSNSGFLSQVQALTRQFAGTNHAEPGQGPVLGLPLEPDPHGQPIRGHQSTIDAGSQQGRAGQPPERLVNPLRPGGYPETGQEEQAC